MLNCHYRTDIYHRNRPNTRAKSTQEKDFRFANCTVLILSLVTMASFCTGVMYFTARRRKVRIEEKFGTRQPAITSQILQLKNKSFSTPEQN